MNYLAPKWTTRRLATCVSVILAWPGTALAGFVKPLQDLPEHIGTGAFAIDQSWSLVGLIGLVVVIALLAGFYRRDKEQ